MAEWDSVRTFLPDRKNGSWIIVSSQQYEIASLCVGHPYSPVERSLSFTEHSVCAFLREGSQDAISTEYDPSHNQMNGHYSYHRKPNSKTKAARDWMQNSPLVGCRLQTNQLRHYTVQAQMNHSQVVSVWGMAGVGKSALVRNLYYDRVIENQQFQEYGWVGLSHSQSFNLRDFSRSLLLDFQSESLHSIVGLKDAVGKCCELLSTRRCLVVIDGLQSIHEWDLIQSSLVSRHSKSKTVFIVITTEASVAAYCAENEELVFRVKALEADAAFDLLKNEVSKKTPLPVSLSYRGNEVLPELISKCGGLPLIIVAVASILATKGGTWMDTASSINLRFMHEIEINPEFECLWDLFSWMHSCFRSCPDSVKPCIFDLSLFPRDYNIRRRRLIRRWIADGYSQDSDGKSAEENGEEFFSKLHNLSIIQQQPESATFSDIRMVLCRVNGFLRECICSQGMQENLVYELAGTCSLPQRTGRHLVILESWGRDRIVLESIDLSRLRSMTVFGEWKPFFISQSTKLLRVLDLEDAVGVTNDDVEQMVKLLPCLMFLSLRGCDQIFQLPRSLGDLRQLQTLDVTNTSIITLPASITKLQKLQYIRAGAAATASQGPTATTGNDQTPQAIVPVVSGFFIPDHPLRCVVPRGIGKLTALHTLGVVNIGASEGEAILKELKNLTQLRKLGVFGVSRKNSEAFSSAISSHVHLRSLSVWLEEESRGCLGDMSLPLENLLSLKLYGLRDRLPVLQVNQLSKLTKLHLKMNTLMDEAIESLGKLPKLCILRLCVNQPEYGQLRFHVFTDGLEELSYQKVKVLDIACRSSVHVNFGSKAMKKLELLTVECYYGSSYQFSGLGHLSQLKEVWLKGSYEEALKEQLQGQLASHPMEPVLKLEE
ncbi:disease resistance protein Pik-2 [Triticum aestivum]|uniref:disease resistance protein Pik-2 n=1 Tax=Triticum aestivum TaxID=4565 RepID=UPI001D031C63|nr:disease resistance protein Pik-2-like [Triticum aestivum]